MMISWTHLELLLTKMPQSQFWAERHDYGQEEVAAEEVAAEEAAAVRRKALFFVELSFEDKNSKSWTVMSIESMFNTSSRKALTL